jgi:hypothetical protein
MGRYAYLLGVLATAALLPGCVERRFVIESDNAPGAFVLHNNEPIGAAPADDFFLFYGKHDFTLFKDGFETLQVQQDVPTPWYEYPPLDFISENLVPWTIRDVRRFTYHMQPVQQPRSDEVIDRAEQLRNRGKSIQPPDQPPAPPPAPPPPAPLPAHPRPGPGGAAPISS